MPFHGVSLLDDIAGSFVDLYNNAGYQRLAPGSLLDPATPMTYVGSAGLTQIETGIEDSEDHAGERYVLVQPCFRHFDLEKVGHSPVHLSLFEMGGAFTFGRVDRLDTLSKIWEFLVDGIDLPAERLRISWFGGGEVSGRTFAPDVSTYEAWLALGVYPSQMTVLGPRGGFWKQGGGLSGRERFRKCGATTEIFFDLGEENACGPACAPGCRCGRFVELSNILFIHDQLDAHTGTLTPLITPFDEAVIGVERLAMVQQQQSSVFDLDAFAPLITWVQQQPASVQGHREEITSARVIADHIRALLFLTADGAPPPGKGGRARIMRLLVRGILTHQQVLHIESAEFIPALIETALALFPERWSHLEHAREPLLEYFALETPRFVKTLHRGLRELERRTVRLHDNRIAGEQMLTLVKNYGVPLPLLRAALVRRGLVFDMREYRRAHMQWRRTVVSAE
ncbi:MAG: hypothetical protein JW720_10055 [Sedimentisphaerales bacterium]|nr:hypothetical protein [Sedimentisphaerales bacterium]